MAEIKTCLKCNNARLIEEFRPHQGKRHPWCRPCEKIYARNYYRQNSEEIRSRRGPSYSPHAWRKHKYGLTPEGFTALYVSQDGRCAVCQTSKTSRELDVDHCHETGKVRGLLCGPCNRGIGQLKDDPSLVMAAAIYIAKDKYASSEGLFFA